MATRIEHTAELQYAWISWSDCGTYAVIHDFEVDAEHRGKGYGAKAYALWEQSLPKRVKRVKLSAVGPAAMDFWQRTGFVHEYEMGGYVPGANEPGEEEFYAMVKSIDGRTVRRRRYTGERASE